VTLAFPDCLISTLYSDMHLLDDTQAIPLWPDDYCTLPSHLWPKDV